MPTDRSYIVPTMRKGMEHDHYDYRPLNATRPVLRWPNHARVALCVIITLEHLEWKQPADGYILPTLSGGYGNRPFPDITRWSHREYGHRVGIFRVLDTLQDHGIKATVAMDAMTAQGYPFLARHCVARGCEIVAHGVSVSRMVTSKMSEQQEREYIKTSIEAIKRATGRMPQGWFSPEYGESTRTPGLLAEAGIRYVCDWANDEQPYAFKVPKGELHALPITHPLDDVEALWERGLQIDTYNRMIKDAFDRLYRDGAKNGRLLVLNLHPWLIGQAFRAHVLDDALGHILRRQGVWAATGSEIIEWYRKNPPVA